MATAPLPPTTPDVATAPSQPALSQIERVVNTFIAPSKTFTDLNRSGSWWLPYLLVAIVWLGFVYVVQQKVGFEKVTENQIAMVPRAARQFDQLPVEQRNQQIAQRAKGTLIFNYAKSVLRILWLLAVAAVLMATFRFGLSANVPFKTSLAIVVYASLPMILQLILAIASLSAGMSPDGFNPDNPIMSNPSFLVNPGESFVLYSVLAPIDIFAIWTLTLTAIGFSCVSKVKRSTALIVVFGWYVLLALIGIGVAVAFS